MRKYFGYISLVAIVVLYVTIQTATHYETQKSKQTLITSELEHNINTLKEHPLDKNLVEYDKKYGTTLSKYHPTQSEMNAFVKHVRSKDHMPCLEYNNCSKQELVTYTKKLIQSNNDEPFWGIHAIMKCFIFPLIAGVAAGWILKKMKIL